MHYKNKNYQQFVEDMIKVGIEVEDYEGRFNYHGPAARTNIENNGPDLQDIIRATQVKLQWDDLGKRDYIIYPC